MLWLLEMKNQSNGECNLIHGICYLLSVPLARIQRWDVDKPILFDKNWKLKYHSLELEIMSESDSE